MWPTDGVPLDPLTDGRLGLREAIKAMLPDTLLLQTAEESLDNPVLLRCVRRDELLRQPIVPTGSPEWASPDYAEIRILGVTPGFSVEGKRQ
jgi:hypothetical protein